MRLQLAAVGIDELAEGLTVAGLGTGEGHPGKDLIKYGTSRLDNMLLRDHLIDEFRFWIMPVVAGAGQRLFEDVDTSGLHLRLTHERRLENGSVILTYTPR